MKYKNPASTVDIIVSDGRKVLLIKRKNEPFKDKWALPGGFINYGKEDLPQAAARELKEETGLELENKEHSLDFVGVYSDPKRDPRGHVISHVYCAFETSVKGWKTNTLPKVSPMDDAVEAKWFSLRRPPPLAFDHAEILKDYIRREEAWS